MNYLDFERPIAELEEKYAKCAFWLNRPGPI